MTRTILLAVLAAACQQESAAGVTEGSEVYAKMCVTCHGSYGQPTAAMTARLGVRDLTSTELRSRITPELVDHQVRKGSPNKLMPAFEGALTDEQIKAVAAYVASPEFLSRRE